MILIRTTCNLGYLGVTIDALEHTHFITFVDHTSSEPPNPPGSTRQLAGPTRTTDHEMPWFTRSAVLLTDAMPRWLHTEKTQ